MNERVREEAESNFACSNCNGVNINSHPFCRCCTYIHRSKCHTCPASWFIYTCIIRAGCVFAATAPATSVVMQHYVIIVAASVCCDGAILAQPWQVVVYLPAVLGTFL